MFKTTKERIQLLEEDVKKYTRLLDKNSELALKLRKDKAVFEHLVRVNGLIATKIMDDQLKVKKLKRRIRLFVKS